MSATWPAQPQGALTGRRRARPPPLMRAEFSPPCAQPPELQLQLAVVRAVSDALGSSMERDTSEALASLVEQLAEELADLASCLRHGPTAVPSVNAVDAGPTSDPTGRHGISVTGTAPIVRRLTTDEGEKGAVP